MIDAQMNGGILPSRSQHLGAQPKTQKMIARAKARGFPVCNNVGNIIYDAAPQRKAASLS